MSKLQRVFMLKTKKPKITSLSLADPLTLVCSTSSYSDGQCVRRGLSQASGTVNSAEDGWKADRAAHASAVSISSIFMKHTSNGSHPHHQGKRIISPIDS